MKNSDRDFRGFTLNERLPQIIGVWREKNQGLTFNQIHRILVEKGLVKNQNYRASTTRILKKLMSLGLVEKIEGKYYLRINPKPFNLLEYLGRIASEKGGSSYNILGCEVHLLGGSEDELDKVANIASILINRLASIYNALNDLVYSLRKGRISPDFNRQLLLESFPYVLDLESLDNRDLFELLENTVKNMPEKISHWPDTSKGYWKGWLLETLQKINSLAEKEILKSGEEEIEEVKSFFESRTIKDFAIALTPSRTLIDEKTFLVEPKILELLKEGKNYSDGYLLFSLSSCSGFGRYQESVESALKTYAKIFLGEERTKRLQELWELLVAGNELEIILRELYGKEYEISRKEYKLRPEESEVNLFNWFKEEIVERDRLEKALKGLWLAYSQTGHPDIFKNKKLLNRLVYNQTEKVFELLQKIGKPANKEEIYEKIMEGIPLAAKLSHECLQDSIRNIEEYLKREGEPSKQITLEDFRRLRKRLKKEMQKNNNN